MSLRDWPILRQLCPDFFATIRMAFVFGDDALLITSEDKIFGVGTNSSGCLGVEHSETCPLPTEIVSLVNKGIKGIVCGGEAKSNRLFVVAYTRTGDIYQWGFLPRQFDFSYSNKIIPQKIHSNLNSKVITVACGDFHCVILSDDGKVYSWGNNGVGQLGHSENQTLDWLGMYGSNSPYQVKGILEKQFAIEISCGASFSVVLLDNGKVITWGSNDCGQLGVNSIATHSPVPVEVSSLNTLKIRKIACGSAHVLALSEANAPYSWGSNLFSQLGFTNSSKPTVTCYKVPIDLKNCFQNRRIIDIGASYACDLSVAQCETKEVFMFGKLSSGKIIRKPIDSHCESIDQVFADFAGPTMMRKPMRHILEAKRRTTIIDTLESEFGNVDTSDLTIVVGKNKIPVHQTILKMRSEYFRTMLSRWIVKDEKVITIKKKSFEAIKAYIKYLYTDKLEVDLNLAVESFLLADEYGDDNFKYLCERSIKRDIEPEKVAEVFALTRKIEPCKDLNQFCLNFILNHAAEVVGTLGFRKWDAETTKAVFKEYVIKKEKS